MAATSKLHVNDILNNPLYKERMEMDARDIFTVEKKEKTVVPDVISLEDLPKTGRMLVRIELDKFSKDSSRMHVVAEIDNQDDLSGFLFKFRDYIPGKSGWWKWITEAFTK